MGYGKDIERALDVARSVGAAVAEVSLCVRAGHRVTFHRGKLVRSEPFSEARAELAAWRSDGRGAARTVVGPDLPALALPELARAVVGEVGPTTRHPGGRLYANPKGLMLEDRRHTQISEPERAEVLLLAERQAKGTDRRATTEPFTWEEVLIERAWGSSRGALVEERGTVYAASGAVRVEEGLRSASISGSVRSRAFSSAASLPFGADLGRRAAGLLRPLVAPPVDAPVLLSPRATAALVDLVSSWFDADPPVFLRETRFDRRLHLIDDGTAPGGLRTTAFDDRGVGPAPLTLLQEGVLAGLRCDPESAAIAGVRPTGHVQDGRSAPRNLALKAGTRSLSTILAGLGGMVLDLDHVAAPDPVALREGRLEGRVWGRVLEGGEVIGAVRDRPVVVDLRESLSQLVEVASDADRHGHVDAPALLLAPWRWPE